MHPRHRHPRMPFEGLFLLSLAGACAASGGGPATPAETDAGAAVDGAPPPGALPDGSANDAPAADASGNPRDAAAPDAPSDVGTADGREAAAPGPDGEAPEAAPGLEAGTGCAALPFCADFENDPVGGPPSAATWTITTGCGMTDPGSTVTVDDAEAHGGARSVKVVGGRNTCGPLLTSTTAFAGLSGDVFGRFFVRFSAGMPQEHSAFLVLGLSADAGVAMNPSNGLQLTGQLAVLDWNWHDATLPDIDTMGAMTSVDPTPNQWTCVEWETNAASGAIAAWVDGAPVAGLTFDPGTTALQPSVNNTWSSGRPMSLTPTTLSLGWISYGGTMMTAWFDDVALAGRRIGCQ